MREKENQSNLTLALKDKSCIRAIQLLARAFCGGNKFIYGRLASMIPPRGEFDVRDLRSGTTYKLADGTFVVETFLTVSKCTRVMVGLCSFRTEYPFIASI